MKRVQGNILAISDGPFKFQVTVGPWSGKHRPSLIDIKGSFVDYTSLSGNSKQRRQQRRKLIRELNQ